MNGTMFDLDAAIKKLSFANLAALWEDMQQLPSSQKNTLKTLAILSFVVVVVLLLMLAWARH